MKKEDYQSHNNGIPIDLIFIPESLQIDFKQKIKLQVAFYRGSKVCKSTPAKFLKSNAHNNRITLQPQKLHFCTTIGYDVESKTFQSKIMQINVQLAYQADAEKETIDARIDLKDILNYQSSFEKTGLFVILKNDIKLFYGINGKITNFKHVQQSPSKSPEKNVHEKLKALPKVDGKQNEQAQRVAIQAVNSPRNQKLNRQKQLQTQIESYIKKIKTLQQKHRETTKKYQLVNQQNSNLKLKLKQSESTGQQKQKQIVQIEKLLQRITEQKNTLLSNLGKKGQEEQEAHKKVQMIDKLHLEIEHLKSVNNEYKNKIDEIKKSQAQIRSKYQESERKNLALISELSDAHYNYQKLQKEQEKNQKTIQKLEKQLKQNSIQDNRPQSEQTSKSKDAEIQRLGKLLQRKEEMITILKKQTEMKKNEQNQDIIFLKKQNKQLKEEIQKFKDPKKDSVSLQLKIQNEKLKKQCLEAKREEKKMLSQKSEIENKNKEMHLQIVRVKETIGKILNIVQEHGSSDLFTQIADCVA